MSDQPTDRTKGPSGSRWEPDPHEAPTAEAPVAASEPDATSTYPGVVPAAPLDDPASEERRVQLRGRAILAGAATALTLGGGLTGFVIGHATAGDDTNGFQPANFSNQGPGGGQFEGQQGPPSFRDDDGDGFSPPQGLDGGSSSDGSTSSGTGSTGTGT